MSLTLTESGMTKRHKEINPEVARAVKIYLNREKEVGIDHAEDYVVAHFGEEVFREVLRFFDRYTYEYLITLWRFYKDIEGYYTEQDVFKILTDRAGQEVVEFIVAWEPED
jgi:hypothetical protein